MGNHRRTARRRSHADDYDMRRRGDEAIVIGDEAILTGDCAIENIEFGDEVISNSEAI